MKTLTKYIIALGVLTVFTGTPVAAKDGDVKICGVIQSIDTSQVSLNGVSYPLENDTEYEDENGSNISLSDFSVGELIELRIRNGRVDQLEKENEANCGGGGGSGGDDNSSDDDNSDDDDDSSDDNSDDDSDDDNDDSGGSENRERICGRISALTSSSITVGTREYTVTSDTEFESNSGTSLSFSAFSVGDYVKLDIRNGSLHEVEFETSASCRSSKVTESNNNSGIVKNTTKRTRLRTKLGQSNSLSTSAKGSARYQSKAKRGKARDRFKIKVRIPIPSTNPAITSASDAALVQLLVFIQRGTDTLASCQLEFDEVDKGAAEFKLDLRERDGSFVAKKGSCDIDLAQAGTQSGIPSFSRGDDLTIVQGDLSSLLEGQF